MALSGRRHRSLFPCHSRLEDHRLSVLMRGLSLAPLWERVPANRLNLDGISWVIVGGESGRKDFVRPFHLKWAEEIHEYCQNQGVAFFLKQLGRVPCLGGDALILQDSHGGDWEEWSQELRVREFPEYFFAYRSPERLTGENEFLSCRLRIHLSVPRFLRKCAPAVLMMHTLHMTLMRTTEAIRL